MNQLVQPCEWSELLNVRSKTCRATPMHGCDSMDQKDENVKIRLNFEHGYAVCVIKFSLLTNFSLFKLSFKPKTLKFDDAGLKKTLLTL